MKTVQGEATKRTPPKKTPAKTKKAPVKNTPVKEETAVEPVVEAMAQPGTYLRDNGFVFLTEEFNMGYISNICGIIMEYNMMPEELAPERITLMINSPGGRIDSCQMLVDIMKTSTIPVDTFATGMTASCGLMILMAGDDRMASSSASLMSHQYSAGARGKEHELYSRVRSFEQTSEWLETHYQECTGLTIKKIRKKLLGKTDFWMTPQEALSLNIIDEVIDPYKVNKMLQLKRKET